MGFFRSSLPDDGLERENARRQNQKNSKRPHDEGCGVARPKVNNRLVDVDEAADPIQLSSSLRKRPLIKVGIIAGTKVIEMIAHAHQGRNSW